jgi:hypothetical protein
MEAHMRKFLAGLAVGLALGTASSAVAARLVGDSGYLFGFTVTYDGETVCDDPWIWAGGINEIEC